MQTIKLYDDNAYETSFEATVISCEKYEKKENSYRLLLDKTLFFPEEGGQQSDIGMIDDAKVCYVEIVKEVDEEKIYHIVDKDFKEGTVVSGKVDFTRRFDQMQQHSGEHIFSGLVHSKYGYNNVGFHLGENIVTLDFDGMLTDSEVLEIEQMANEIISKNVAIKTYYPSESELEKLDYRSKKKLEGPVRIVEIEGVDICACCAPHVRMSGEITLLKVTSRINYKGGVRISIECGKRALKTLFSTYEMMKGIAANLSTSMELVDASIKKQADENQKLRAKLLSIKNKIIDEKINEIDVNKDFLYIDENLDMKFMQHIVNGAMEKTNMLCIAFSMDGDKCKFVIGSADEKAQDAFSILKAKFKVKGGGSSKMVQGSIENVTKEDLENIKL